MQFANRRVQNIFLCAALLLLGSVIGYKIGIWVWAGEIRIGWIDLAYLPLVGSLVGVMRTRHL